MHHRASRLHAVVAVLLLAFGALGISAVAASHSSASDPSGASEARGSRQVGTRHEAFASRATFKAATHAGPQTDVAAVLTALAVGTLLLLGWHALGRGRLRLPRRVAVSLGARAPPTLV